MAATRQPGRWDDRLVAPVTPTWSRSRTASPAAACRCDLTGRIWVKPSGAPQRWHWIVGGYDQVWTPVGGACHSGDGDLVISYDMGSDQRDNSELVLAVFTAVERRDTQRFTELVQPDFEIHWPRSLPMAAATAISAPTRSRAGPPGPQLGPAATDRGPAAHGSTHRRLARAQMFHFDTVALAGFLERASEKERDG
jgi:hypothetical protein